MDAGEWVDAATSALNGGVGLVLAALVLASTPRRAPHLTLVAFLLAAAGNAVASLVEQLATDPWLVYNGYFYSGVTLVAITAFYAMFIGVAIPSPLARPLRPALVRGAVAVAFVAATSAAFVSPTLLVVARPDGALTIGPLYAAAGTANGVVLLLALVASLDALRRAPPGSAARSRARAYAIAFGVQDVGVLAAMALRLGAGDPMDGLLGNVLLSTAVTAGWVLLARAMIREHLLDADLKLKVGLRRGTVAAFFLGAFFIVAAVAEQYLQQYGTIVGGVAVGLMLLALRPLERAAARLADSAMPSVRDTPEYRTVRKREVYRAAVEGALQDGHVSEKERDVLARVADQLGLTMSEALEIERETRAALPAA